MYIKKSTLINWIERIKDIDLKDEINSYIPAPKPTQDSCIPLPMDEIIELYQANTPLVEIANKYYVSISTIKNRLKKIGIQRVKKYNGQTLLIRKIDPAIIAHLYLDDRLTLAEIGDRYNCSGPSVAKILRENGFR